MKTNIIKEYLDNQGWRYVYIEDKNVFIFGINGMNSSFQCIINLEEDKNESKFTFISICGTKTPSEKRIKLLKHINDLNYNLFLGNFEMNWNDGEIRFKTSTLFESIPLSENRLNYFIMSNIHTMDKNINSIMELIYEK